MKTVTIQDTIRKQVAAVKTAHEKNQTETKQQRASMWKRIKKVSEFSSRYEDAWAGNWVEHTNLYRFNFNATQDELRSLTDGDIKRDLHQVSGVNLDAFRTEIPPISKKFFALKDFVVTELALILDMDTFNKEIELLKQVESFKWGAEPGSYIRLRRPQRIMTDDPFILNRGLQTPPHILVGEEIIFTTSLLASYDSFEQLMQRLTRQLELKTDAPNKNIQQTVTEEQGIYRIIERFHLSALQLQHRHDSRDTLTITDEYDVQDLMHVLLQLYYDDVRPEENAPSFAGRASRMDFLLKQEKIVLEVKKTRANLKAKEIGDELAIDVAHYRAHPDCKRLVCFVYDPDRLVKNPRGVERDLNSMSTADMAVELFIRS